ncbi:exocyst complex component EXO70A1-like protein [Tanacetum coccineum]
MEGVIWQESFGKIADKIMAVFFWFGEGVARSNKEPQKLFKLLDMFNSLENRDENLLREAISNVMEALQRNIKSKRSGYKDKVLYHVFTMNTYWYIYMRTRNTEVGKLLGENFMRKNNKVVTKEAAYLYEKQAWGGFVRLLDKEEIDGTKEGGTRATAKGKIEIKEATIKLIVPVYQEFLDESPHGLSVKAYSSPESIEGLLG